MGFPILMITRYFGPFLRPLFMECSYINVNAFAHLLPLSGRTESVAHSYGAGGKVGGAAVVGEGGGGGGGGGARGGRGWIRLGEYGL